MYCLVCFWQKSNGGCLNSQIRCTCVLYTCEACWRMKYNAIIHVLQTIVGGGDNSGRSVSNFTGTILTCNKQRLLNVSWRKPRPAPSFNIACKTLAANLQSVARLCNRLLAGIAGSNPAGDTDVCLSLVNVVCCADRSLCDGPIYIQRGPTECDQVQQWVGRWGQTKKGRKEERKKEKCNINFCNWLQHVDPEGGQIGTVTAREIDTYRIKYWQWCYIWSTLSFII